MEVNQEVTEEKKLKTWDEAVNELRAFIIKSKEEEQQQRAKEEKSGQ